MRIWIQLVLFIRQPQASVSVKDLFAEGREELLEYPSTIDTSSTFPTESALRSTAQDEIKLTPPVQIDQ
jgi:hypothetical protein